MKFTHTVRKYKKRTRRKTPKKKGGSEDKQKLIDFLFTHLLGSDVKKNHDVIKQLTPILYNIAVVIIESGVLSEAKKWLWSSDRVKEKITTLLEEKNKTLHYVADNEAKTLFSRVASILSSPESIRFLKNIGDIDIEDYTFSDVTPKQAKVYIILGSGCAVEGNMEKVKNTTERQCKRRARNETQEKWCETSLAETYEQSELKRQRENYAEKFDLPKENVFILCETSMYKVVSRMAKQLVMGAIPYSHLVLSQPFDKMGEKTVLSIIQDILTDNKVYVYGFSYGGSMANKLAVKLQAYAMTDPIFMEKQKWNLIMTTCGSPIIAEFETIKDINIHNYLHVGDGRVDWIHKEKEPTLVEFTERIDRPNGGYWLSTVSSTNPSVTWIDRYTRDGIRFIDHVAKSKNVDMAQMVHNMGYLDIEVMRENEFRAGVQ
jgi:hypothetical protein